MNLQQKMFSYHGIKEIPGDAAHPVILSFFKNIGHEWNRSDETGWCTAMINSCLKDIGLEYSSGLDARSLMEMGQMYNPPSDGVSFDDNVIVIFWRVDPDDWRGHAGVPLFIDWAGGVIWTFGGNQSDQAKTSPYLIDGKNHGLIGFRKLNLR